MGLQNVVIGDESHKDSSAHRIPLKNDMRELSPQHLTQFIQ